jgi:hypothetical protein
VCQQSNTRMLEPNHVHGAPLVGLQSIVGGTAPANLVIDAGADRKGRSGSK